MSASPPKADKRPDVSDVRFVPLATLVHCSAGGLLKHLVGSSLHRLWDCDPEQLRSLKIDHQLELCGLYKGEVCGFRAFQDGAIALSVLFTARQHLDQPIQIFLAVEERLHQNAFVLAVHPHVVDITRQAGMAISWYPAVA
jgi:hypothetical protein